MRLPVLKNRAPHGGQIDIALKRHLQEKKNPVSHLDLAKKSRKILELRRKELTKKRDNGKITENEYQMKREQIDKLLEDLSAIIHFGYH